MDLQVGHLNAKKLLLCAKKEVELPSVELQTSLLLSCFLFTLSYGAGCHLKRKCLNLKKCFTGMGAVTYAMPGGISLKAAKNI